MKLECCVPPAYGRLANSGGPLSRTRKERVRATLLGNDEGAIRCPRILRVGFRWPYGDPLAILGGILAEEGYGHPEDLRGELTIPEHVLIARPCTESAGIVDPGCDTRRDVLWHALMLGLCTAQLYDPARPVLWTQASLARRLELFDPAGFYA